jgi:hypothetical protein
VFRKLFWMMKDPEGFFNGIRKEGYREPFIFFLQVSMVISFFTPIVNYLGWPSTDYTSSYQAQIIAWQIASEQLLPRLGAWAYVVEAFLILGLALIISVFLAMFLHLIFRTFGGEGPILNAWKATCYGTGPCLLLGWVPYWTIFVGSWSFVLQLYFGPKILYRMREGRALLILAFFIGATLLEFAIKGTTVGFSRR